MTKEQVIKMLENEMAEIEKEQNNNSSNDEYDVFLSGQWHEVDMLIELFSNM